MEAKTSDTTPAAKGTTAEVSAVAILIEIPSSPDLDNEIEMWTPREKRRLEEDCQILASDPLASASATAAAGNGDIEVVAERGKVACRDFPHPRSACAKNPFNSHSS